MATFVLVHGSWAGGWAWAKVRPLLEQAGHRVLAPSLTGLSDRGHLAGPEVGLSTHIQDIARLLEWEDLEGVVLVGHSYGGMVITGVAGVVPERIGRLVYLDAFRPRPGQSAIDQLTFLPEILGEPPAEHPWGYRLPDVQALGLSDPADVAWLTGKSTPMPTLTHREPLPEPVRTGSAPIPTTYVRGAQLPLFVEMAQIARAEGVDVREWEDAGHVLPVTHPDRVAHLLLDLAGEAVGVPAGAGRA
jgi:pimeloyl-ACP methyl ester carboxylesterase